MKGAHISSDKTHLGSPRHVRVIDDAATMWRRVGIVLVVVFFAFPSAANVAVTDDGAVVGGGATSDASSVDDATDVSAGASAGAAAVDDDDDFAGDGFDSDDDSGFIVLEEDEEVLIDDDRIVIYGDDDIVAFPRISGPLGRLWDSLHVGGHGRIDQAAQLVALEDLPFRTTAEGALEGWLLPAPNLSFYAGGFARASVDVGPNGVRLVPVADMIEAYAKVNAEVGSVLIGKLIVPWGRTQYAALGDRLNPPDHRRLPGAFPNAVAQKQPQWGIHLRTSFVEVAVEAVLLTMYEPTEGSLAASEQGGVRGARYQTALVRSPARAYDLFSENDRSSMVRDGNLVDMTTAGLMMRRRVGDFDIGASAVTGIDDVPTLHLRGDAAKVLTAELLPRSANLSLPCGNNATATTASCLGNGFLSHDRATSLTADAAWGLGLAIVKAEVLAQPKFGLLTGKSALLVDETGLRSERVSHYAIALALEAGFAEWVEGSIELFDLLWVDVPAGARLWGVELLGANASTRRTIHRVGVGATLGGSVFGQTVDWRLRGETGVLQPDVLMRAEVIYRLPFLGLHVGGRGLLFSGLPGSPGWFRQDGSQLGVFVGEGG